MFFFWITLAHTQVPHVDHRQGAEKQRGLELQVVKVAKQGEVEDDPEAHEERSVHHQLGLSRQGKMDQKELRRKGR